MQPYYPQINCRQSGFVTIEDARIYYEVYGDGPPLCLINGLGLDGWFWEKQVPAFAKSFTTIIIDNRGAGRSDKPPGPYAIPLMADDIITVLNSLKVKSTNMLGFSLGSRIAREIALTSPTLVHRLILAASSPGYKKRIEMTAATRQLLATRDGDPFQLFRKKLALAFTEEYLASMDLEAYIAFRIQYRQPQDAFEAQVAAGVSYDRSDQLAGITQPCYILAGGDDPITVPENAGILHKLLPNSKLKIYPNLRHQFLVEDAETVNQDIYTFLEAQ